MRRICVTGPESTGKTTLALRLAETLGTVCVPEASRVYAERLGRALSVDDVEPIAREHIALADAAAEASTVVLDTDLISTIVYASSYYGYESPWLEREARERLADLYLLCDVDVPWVADGIRDRPDDRAGMFALFRDALEERGARFVVIGGDWQSRWDAILGAV